MGSVNRPNGWQRLWLVLSAVWLLVVCGMLATISSIEPNADAVLETLPLHYQALLRLERVEGVDGPYGGRTLMGNVDEKDTRAGNVSTAAVKAFDGAYTAARRALWLSQARSLAPVFAVPVVLVYAGGWSFGRIYRGFRRGPTA